jgi:hypothetical protein
VSFLHHARDTVVWDQEVREALEEWMLERRQLMHQEWSSGIKDQDLKEHLCLRKERTSGRIFRQTIELEITKLTVGTSIGLWKMNVRTLCRDQPPPKRKKRPLTTD